MAKIAQYHADTCPYDASDNMDVPGVLICYYFHFGA